MPKLDIFMIDAKSNTNAMQPITFNFHLSSFSLNDIWVVKNKSIKVVHKSNALAYTLIKPNVNCRKKLINSIHRINLIANFPAIALLKYSELLQSM